jgi:hypothetical protein
LAAGELRVAVPQGYADLFEDLADPLGAGSQKFWLTIADHAASSIVRNLISRSDQIVTDAGIELPTSEGINAILDRFRLAAPASRVKSLADILNAGWMGYHDRTLWQDHPEIRSKDEMLGEIVLKSIEVLEIQELLGRNA